MKPTGYMRYRVNWRGKVILQLEFEYEYFDHCSITSYTKYKWRDARPQDITMKEFKNGRT